MQSPAPGRGQAQALGLTEEVRSAEESLEVLVDKVKASQQRATAVTKANHRLHGISKSKTSRNSYLVLGTHEATCRIFCSVVGSPNKRDLDILDSGEWRTTEMGRRLAHDVTPVIYFLLFLFSIPLNYLKKFLLLIISFFQRNRLLFPVTTVLSRTSLFPTKKDTEGIGDSVILLPGPAQARASRLRAADLPEKHTPGAGLHPCTDRLAHEAPNCPEEHSHRDACGEVRRAGICLDGLFHTLRFGGQSEHIEK
ncbi:hypothetical protein QYF61_022030 [Mycteria americana]|uniref:Uncharacterized protein n=1 Tax=Mycteria americana TaxID=33587 RepID=A0AAN7RXY7_MYCAM|nr:hypothetical protein QYF61_022030 [Mycteria americana]